MASIDGAALCNSLNTGKCPIGCTNPQPRARSRFFGGRAPGANASGSVGQPGGAHRLVSRSAVGASTGSVYVSARNRSAPAMAREEQGPQGQGSVGCSGKTELGPQRTIHGGA